MSADEQLVDVEPLGLEWLSHSAHEEPASSAVMVAALTLLDRGWSRARVLRQLAGLRAILIPDPAAVDVTAGFLSAVRDVRRRLLAGGSDRPRVLVVSEDEVIRSGLDIALARAGVLGWPVDLHDLPRSAAAPWDYIFVWLRAKSGIDPYGAIHVVGGLAEALGGAPVIAIHDRPLSLVVQLRLAEAGFRYLLPLHWLSDSIPSIASTLSNASLPLSFHLPTPLALRERLGFGLSGDLAAFLREALALSSSVWAGHLPQSHLPIPRGEVRRLRRLALELAGLPLPSFSAYATSAFRKPPDAPEWPRVRGLVRAALDLDSTPRASGSDRWPSGDPRDRRTV